MGTTGGEALAIGPNGPAIGGCRKQLKSNKPNLIDSLNQHGRCQKRSTNTLTLTASDIVRDPSNDLPSSILNRRRPSVFANIFIPLSLVVTASNDPSLLNRNLGLAYKKKKTKQAFHFIKQIMYRLILVWILYGERY